MVVLKAGYNLGNQATPATYDISPDGQRFLMIKSADLASAASTPAIAVVQNWFEELRRSVPAQ